MRLSPVVLVCAAALSLPAPALSEGVFTGAEVMMATVLEEGQSSFSGIGARGRIHPAALAPGIDLLPGLEYWRHTTTISPYDISATDKDATLAAHAAYTFQREGWAPYVGLGYAVHFLSSRVDAPALGLNDATNSVMKGGLSALAGVSFPLNERISNFIDLEYHHITDYKQLKINWGLGFKL